MLARKAALARARAHLERIERKWAMASGGRPSLRKAAPLALDEGALHEIRIEDWRARASAVSFALALAGPRGGAIVLVQLAHEARTDGALFARGLEGLGVAPGRLVAAFAQDEKRFFWALEEAAREKGLAAVIALAPRGEKLLDLTATRRLALAAEGAAAAPIIIRTMTVAAPTAAAIRWKIEPAPSRPDPDDARAPGAPRWRVSLERFRADGRLCACPPFLAELRHDGRNLHLSETTPVLVPVLPLLADGPEETHRAFTRRERRAAHSF